MASREYWKRKFDEWFQATKLEFQTIDETWVNQGDSFRKYWDNKINKPEYAVTQADIEGIIRILDTKARGNFRAIAVADLFLRQNMQEELIKGIKSDDNKRNLLNTFLLNKEEEDKISAIDQLQSYESRGNGPKLTTLNGVFLNALAYAYSPDHHVNIVSLDKEKSIIERFEIPTDIDFERDSYGKRIVKSNKAILDYFREIGINEHTYVIGAFVWYVLSNITDESETENVEPGTFYLEKYLQELLVQNWEKIHELNGYKILTNDDGELIGREYRAGNGKIDILAVDGNSNEYVVIELKRNETSDCVAGQLLRYMNWVRENLAGTMNVKGLVIAGDIDESLKLSLADRNDVQIMRYEVNFKLHES